MNKYLEIPLSYGPPKDEYKYQVTFFIPYSFIEKKDLNEWSMEPENFFGVNLKAILKTIQGNDESNP